MNSLGNFKLSKEWKVFRIMIWIIPRIKRIRGNYGSTISAKSEFKAKQNKNKMQDTTVPSLHLKKMAPIDIEFNDLTYAISGKGTIILNIALFE